MASINITPLVDVLLVLLIIFMVAAPVLTRTLPLDLPVPVFPPPPPPPDEPLRLRIDAGGSLLLGGEALAPAQLGARLRVLAQRQPELALDISVAADAPYQHLAGALAAARNAGIRRIGVGEGG